MYQPDSPANGGKKIKLFLPPPMSDPLASTYGKQISHHIKNTFVRQHVSSYNGSRRALTSGNDEVVTGESFHMAKRFILNQRVNVNIEGSGWLVGTVVLLVKVVESLTGSIVRVRYSMPTERNQREKDVPNHPDYIRPL